MSARLSPAEALQQVPGFEVGSDLVSPLPGGLTNRNFLVDHGGHRFVLRLDDVHTRSFGLDRHTERRARRLAADAGLAARVVYDDAARGILLTEYVEGRVLQPTDLRDPETLRAVAQLLRQVHSLPLLGQRFDAPAVAAAYLTELVDPAPFAGRCVQIASGAAPDAGIACCHNDVVAGNIVMGENPILLDWEYAADNDPLFDLASLIGFHDLGERETATLLAASIDGDTTVSRARLAAQLRIFDALQWLWIAVRQRHSPARGLEARLARLQYRLQEDRYG